MKLQLHAIFLLIIYSFNSFAQDSINNASLIDTSFYVPGAIGYNLILATENGYPQEVIRLLNKGADINTTTWDGVTPLMYAIQNQDSFITKILVLNGADIDKKPDSGIPALISSVINNNLFIAEYLIRNGADINITDSRGNTPLMYASAYGHYLILDMLLYYEADAEYKNNEGSNAIMIASYYGDYDMALRLIEAGVDVNSTDNAGLSAIHYAVQNAHHELTELLINNGADINAPTLSGYSPVAVAVEFEHFELVKLLTEKGADINKKISSSENPVSLACNYKNKDIRDYLIQNKGRRNMLPCFNQYTIGLNLNWNFDDLHTGINFGVRDKKYNIALTSGFSIRPFVMRILEKESETLSYQYWERRMAIFLVADKKFSIIKYKDSRNIGISVGAKELYTFGSYRGSSSKPDNSFIFAPGAGIFWEDNVFTININYGYSDFNLYKVNPNRLDLSLHIRINRSRNNYFPIEINEF